jgi:uncharacterized C2H2 Zn-finger protein
MKLKTKTKGGETYVRCPYCGIWRNIKLAPKCPICFDEFKTTGNKTKKVKK